VAIHARPAAPAGRWLAVLAAALLTSACGTAEPEGGGPSQATAGTAAASFGTTECGTEDGTGCAPLSARVDLAEPVFSDPTAVTNPLFPAAEIDQVVLVGTEAGEPLRVEVTRLPEPKTIEWDGQTIDVLAVQYLAHVDGRIHEVAIDWYGQADDGSVWYFGEDVFNYEDGVVADTDGTWLAGRDGPPAMIMPASPQVGDVYRPENAIGLVFEEVTVISVGDTVEGPRGPIDGAITVDELHMDMAHEEKTFAPGYGEFLTGAGSDLEAVALAVPTDARSGTPPPELLSLASGAATALRAAADDDWASASAALDAIDAAWNAVRTGDLPPRLEAQMSDALAALSTSVDARAATEARQATIDARQAAIDLELQYRRLAEVELARIGLCANQLVLDADRDDVGAVLGHVTTLERMRDRSAHHLDEADAGALDDALVELRAAAGAENLDAARDVALQLAETVSRFEARGD
jgi:hypothetical protein